MATSSNPPPPKKKRRECHFDSRWLKEFESDAIKKRGIAPLSSIYGQLLEHSASRGVTLLEMTSSSIKAGVASIKAGVASIKAVVVSGRAWFGNDCPGFHF